MLNGQMLQDQIRLRLLYKKLLFYLQSFPNFSQVKENLGEESYCMDHQEQVNHIWLKLVQLKLMEHSSQCHHQIWFLNGSVNQKDQSNNFSKWQERISQLLYSLMKQILCSVQGVMQTKKQADESKLNFLFSQMELTLLEVKRRVY